MRALTSAMLASGCHAAANACHTRQLTQRGSRAQRLHEAADGVVRRRRGAAAATPQRWRRVPRQQSTRATNTTAAARVNVRFRSDDVDGIVKPKKNQNPKSVADDSCECGVEHNGVPSGYPVRPALTLATLPRKVPAYLLSNTNAPHLEWLLEQFSIFKHFEGGIYSHEAKTMKPEPGMYEQAVAKFDLDPAQTFYVDDLIANIETGRRLGFVSHHYDPQNHSVLHHELNTWLNSIA